MQSSFSSHQRNHAFSQLAQSCYNQDRRLQVLLEVHSVTLPPGNNLIFTHPYFMGYLVYEPEIMADENQTPIPLIQCLSKRVDCLNIQMISWFIQETCAFILLCVINSTFLPLFAIRLMPPFSSHYITSLPCQERAISPKPFATPSNHPPQTLTASPTAIIIHRFHSTINISVVISTETSTCNTIFPDSPVQQHLIFLSSICTQPLTNLLHFLCL